MRAWRLILASLVFSICAVGFADEVRVYEEPLVLPTYRIGAPEIMPYWDRIYPYTMLEKLTGDKYDRTYRALYVENEYVKALVLPEIGGRLHGAQDKTNGYQFLYNQTTIKPGLVGMAGAWISGGVEWNFPHGHRPTGFRDTDYRIEENPDGTKTAWTGEVDQVYGMRWAVGTTVHPGRNWVETKVRLFNSTPYMQSYQMWATAAVRATENYQAVIPTEIATGHYKRQFYNWPVNEGVDLSYWKNIAPASSFFAWNCDADYFGGYSPEEHAGMVHVADHNIVQGKKLWTWGTALSGRIWEKILSDGDLPYFEPQAGAYSDNQPDYHWIMPGETKVYSDFWIPVRDIGVWDYANLEGTLNLDLEKGKAGFGWSPTGVNKAARVIVTSAGTEIFNQSVDTDPARPFIAEAKAPKGADIYSLQMTVLSAAGDTLLNYSHPRPKNPPLPAPTPMPAASAEIKSNDELFVIGDNFEKFRDTEKALTYYEEALRRDPGDIRCNTSLGLLRLKEGQFQNALEYFDKALEREPYFAQARYYKGLAHLWLGQPAEAEKHFNRSSYDQAYYAGAHFELAQLCTSQGRYATALEHIERSIQGNGDNSEAYAVKALILNRAGRYVEALAVADKIQAMDPLDFLSLTEKYFSLANLGREEEKQKVYDQALALSRLDSQNYIELAIRYARCGQYQHAARVLGILVEKGEKVSPLVYYYLAYYEHLLGREEDAARYRLEGGKQSPQYCFPNRLESFPVLEWAIEQNGEDGRALYYLGNLLRSKSRTEEAIAAWEKSVKYDQNNVVAYWDLGESWMIKRDLQKARAAYEKAVTADPSAAMALEDLDRINQMLKMSNPERIALLEKNMETVTSRDPLLKRLVSLYVQTGRYDDALKWLKEHHFRSWEGRYDVHQYWVESNIEKGDQEFKANNYMKALELYQLSLTYPFNLEVAEQPRASHARNRYKVALALEALGKKKEARQTFEQVAAEKSRPDSPYQYYRGKALEKLGRKDEALKAFEQLLAAAEERRETENEHIEEGVNFDPGRNMESLRHYKRYLALEGLGRQSEAEAERKIALDSDPIVALRAFSPPRAGW